MPRTSSSVNSSAQAQGIDPAVALSRGNSATSYRGLMEEPTGNRLFLDLGLIPEFDGSARQSVAEWYQKLELVCRLRGVEDLASVVPLRLKAVPSQCTWRCRRETRKALRM
ncbi:hypothetical protein M514_09405 [Trichuris suis]|uniref:Uncharacterized protein n=1 Tax=Trichuris suis TaxID=68888 RepID=A0A085MXW6_9BILA|nr:hypothetical protein M513_09405 [Trichuris suis]KFD62062.1 hypothetical protein M514_09405 [Trichuris suis]